jgi:hypothetical protein
MPAASAVVHSAIWAALAGKAGLKSKPRCSPLLDDATPCADAALEDAHAAGSAGAGWLGGAAETPQGRVKIMPRGRCSTEERSTRRDPVRRT